MRRAADQVLTAAQMRAAEAALIDAGTSVDELMQRAGRGAAEWVWRVAAGRAVTVLCGPGNNGGDGYVIAEALRARGNAVCLIAASEPHTDAARTARALFQGEVLGGDASSRREVLEDSHYGSGLTRPLNEADAALLRRLAAAHPYRIAIDLPSGVSSDDGAVRGPDLPEWSLTLALGAWKPAHFLMPASAAMGALRLVEIGVAPVLHAASVLAPPQLGAPAPATHKYRRGLVGVVAGAMPGAALLACRAAQHAGAGYVKLLSGEGGAGPSTGSGRADPAKGLQTPPAQPEPVEGRALPADLVADRRSLNEALSDERLAAILIGPGLGRDVRARGQLTATLAAGHPAVLDADALMLLTKADALPAACIATPHEGELAALEAAFGLSGTRAKPDRARALAEASAMIIVAKGPDTVIAAPDGRLTFTPRASSWLSTAGTGDVLAGCIASRLATGSDPFTAAAEGVWLHGEAARLAGPAFTAGELAAAVREAYAAAL